MKILIFNSLYTPFEVGGAERSVQLLAEELANRRHTVTVACTGPTDDRAVVNGVDVRYLRIPNLYWMRTSSSRPSLIKPLWHAIDMDNRWAEPAYWKLITETSPDLIHTNNLAGLSVAVWRAAERAGVPIVHTIRDHYLLCVRSTMFADGRRCNRQCVTCRIASYGKKRQAPRVRAAVGISDYILDIHLAHGFFTNAQLTRTIFNPVPSARASGPALAKDPSRVHLGFVGSLAPHKGIELLLSSLRRLNSAKIDAHIFGRPHTETYGAYLTRTYGSDRVTFHGQQPPERIYQTLDALVVPSLWNEPFGRIVAEANACGVPVVSSNRGGLPELVRDGENGFVFDADRPDSLTETLAGLLADDSWRHTLPEQARRLSRRFSPARIAEQYEQLYGEAVR